MLVIIYKAIVAFFMSIVCLFTSFFTGSTPEGFKPEDPDNVRLTFAAISDTHFAESEAITFLVQLGLSDMQNAEYPLDALVHAGDITDHGYEDQWLMVKKAFADYIPAENIILAEGNHDTWTGDKGDRFAPAKELFIKFNDEICNRKIDNVYYSEKINGYTFIVLGSEDDGVDAYISEQQFAWLEAEMEKAAADELPIFVIFHQPLNLTHGLPGTFGEDEETEITGGIGEQSDRVKTILEKYENVFYISGHIHNGIGDKITSSLYGYSSVESYGNITSVNLPGYSVVSLKGEMNNGNGFVVEVYDNEVVIRARSFSNSTWLTQYEYSIPLV